MRKHKSIITDNWNQCFLCGAYFSDYNPGHEHHCLHGSYHKLAEKYHLTVPLCGLTCHKDLHDKGIKDHYLQALAQQKFQEHYPELDFLKIFGRNFYDD